MKIFQLMLFLIGDFVFLQFGSKLKFKISRKTEKKRLIDFFQGRISRELVGE